MAFRDHVVRRKRERGPEASGANRAQNRLSDQRDLPDVVCLPRTDWTGEYVMTLVAHHCVRNRNELVSSFIPVCAQMGSVAVPEPSG